MRTLFFSKSLLQMAVILLVGIGMNFAVASANEIRYDSGGRRDPFVKLTSPKLNPKVEAVEKIDIQIQGIIVDAQSGSMVLIDGEFYKEGDTVKNANIISIFSDRVIFSQNDRQKTIWLREEVLDINSNLTEEAASSAENIPHE